MIMWICQQILSVFWGGPPQPFSYALVMYWFSLCNVYTWGSKVLHRLPNLIIVDICQQNMIHKSNHVILAMSPLLKIETNIGQKLNFTQPVQYFLTPKCTLLAFGVVPSTSVICSVPAKEILLESLILNRVISIEMVLMAFGCLLEINW